MRYVLCLFLALPLGLRAQVSELWRTTLSVPLPTNAPPGDVVSTNQYLSASAVDAQGNTILGADVSMRFSVPGGTCAIGNAAILAKFDPNGRQLWTSLGGPLAPHELIARAADGSILTRFSFGPLAKYGSDASLQWLSNPFVFDWRFLGCSNDVIGAFFPLPSSLAMDNSGNALLVFGSFDPSTQAGHWYVTKFSATGQRLWNVTLPVAVPSDPGLSPPSMLITASPDDAAIIAGGSTETGGFVARVNPDGQLAWNNQQDKNSQALPVITSLLVNPKGFICAVSSGRADVFSSSGKPTHSALVGGVALGQAADGGFLLGDGGSFFYKLDATSGHVVWSTPDGVPGQRLGVVPDGDGWIIANHEPGDPAVHFEHLDAKKGTISWQQLLTTGSWPPPLSWGGPLSAADSILRAPDGTLRLVAMSSDFVTIQVIGYSVAP